MASYCLICHKKVDQQYIWYKGVKLHKKCRPAAVKLWEEQNADNRNE